MIAEIAHFAPEQPIPPDPGRRLSPRLHLQTRSLRVSYGAKEILHGVDLDIWTGQVTALIGPSGCGKSTFLRSLNRMIEIQRTARRQGQILLDGCDVDALDAVELRRRVGMVFQRPNPFPKSIFDNVAFGPRLHRLTRHPADLVEQSLRRAALWEEVKDSLHRPAASLSGGQQQRLCIARALAVNPEMLLLDEPCSALDPITTAKIEELMIDLKRTCTIVIVTHNMQQAARASDRTAFLLDGSLIEVQPTSRLFTNPADPRTEAYITGRFG